jgi:glycosyltransferase involved in cell wall biosynthesis
MLQLVIPAYNEQERLPRTLRDLRRHVRDQRSLARPVRVIVVDNASTDDTAAVARAADVAALPVRVIDCPIPGKGAAVRAGIAATDAPVVGFMDADGATRLDALEEAFRRLALGADVAIGSRGADGARTAGRHSWLRERGAQTYRACTARVVPGVIDTQCGFKLMDGDLGRRVFAGLRTTGFSFDVEMLARAQALGARIDEFPVTWADVPGSTFDPLRHGAGSFASLALIAWRARRDRVTVPVALPAPVTLPTVAAEA